jgi:uncharacterized protein (DUF1778 family)
MKRSIKRNSGMYSFLENSGLLENGTGEAIEQARKQYWRDFRREYKKARRHEYKSFEIPFSLKEREVIKMGAKRNHTSPTNYIKQSALANQHSIVNRTAIGEIRESVISHHNTLLGLKDENQLPESLTNQLLNQAAELEKRIFDFFSTLK